MASLSKEIQPTQSCGYRQDPDKSEGSLAEKWFSSRCPPVITPDSTIIAVCGPNDYTDNAGPLTDGWYFSDFYLFHHLFRGTAKRQYWLTCVEPKELIRKYQEFVHGDPRSTDRRVVLDDTFVDDVKDVLVFSPKDLLDRFLSCVSDACNTTKGTSNPILVLLFGHGRPRSVSVTIGGTSSVLTPAKFKEATRRHNPTPNLVLLTTSCFGGGWTQTGLVSWPESTSLSRCCGSRYATGVAHALIRSEIQDLDPNSEEEARQSPTFAALVEIIHDILTKEINVRENNMISFLIKDDPWDMQWRARTRFSLITYKEKWESLRQIPPATSTGASFISLVRFSDTIQISIPEAEFRLKRLACDYMHSNPGDSFAARNHAVHHYCSTLLRDAQLTKDELEMLAGTLRYRMETIMARATEYKDHLNLEFPDCPDCDIDAHQGKLVKNPAERKKLWEISDMVLSLPLFDDAEDHEGMSYYKGYHYLAVMFTESGWSRQQIENALFELVRFKGKQSSSRYSNAVLEYKKGFD